MPTRIYCPVIVMLLLSLAFAGAAVAQQPDRVAGLSHQQAMAAGQRMYRDGLLPNGEPMQALVQEDIPVDGSMFTCQSCHLTSGLGSPEGTIITLPTNGAKLYRPLRRGTEIATTPARKDLAAPFQSLDIRPAYTDETLATAIWTGETSSGRDMLWTMPRYLLDPADMDILIYYLKNLSSEYSPGLTRETLKFATIITDDVPESRQQAMLLTLQAYIRDHNSQSRHEGRRAKQGPFYKQDRYTAYREFTLDVWRLTGDPATWPGQLQNYYQRNPVFALLGGISTRDWAPIERFCQAMKLPNLFPVTSRPGLAADNWYTVYLSKGAGQEGEAAARYLRTIGDTREVLQLVAEHPDARRMARIFYETWTGLGNPPPRTVSIPELSAELRKLADDSHGGQLVIWAGGDVLRQLAGYWSDTTGPERILASWSLLEDDLGRLAPSLRDRLELTYPYRLPADRIGRHQFVRGWLNKRNVPETDIDIHSQMYFLGWIMTGVTRMMGNDFYRDYFLDVLDMMNDETYAIANVPRVSFGPAQRYASKGCYIVKPDPAELSQLVPLTPWVIH